MEVASQSLGTKSNPRLGPSGFTESQDSSPNIIEYNQRFE